MNERWVNFFKAHPPILIQVSLYGGNEDTYERVTGHRMFSTVLANIHRLIDADLPVTIAVTPSKYMGEKTMETVHVAHSFGIPFSIAPALFDPKEETGRSGQNHELSLDDYVEVFRLRNKLEGKENRSIDPSLLPLPGGSQHECTMFGLNCGGGMSCFDIDWDGTMHVCNTYRSVVSYPLTDGFLASWNRIHQVAANWPRVPECIECPYEQVCTNCEIKKSAFRGPGKQPLELCERIKYLVSHGVYTISDCP
jgi:radical SAM protein with 4Fe4S-binding SPASM domain